MMINFDNLPQTITAALGAILLSTAFLAASAGYPTPKQPAQASAQVQA